MTGIGLADAIRELRQELTRAIAEGEGESLRFKPGPIALELQLEIEREGDVSTGIKWFVVSASAEGKMTRASTHTIKLTLEPLAPKGGGDLEISRKRGG
jgi:hypothetical protein